MLLIQFLSTLSSPKAVYFYVIGCVHQLRGSVAISTTYSFSAAWATLWSDRRHVDRIPCLEKCSEPILTALRIPMSIQKPQKANSTSSTCLITIIESNYFKVASNLRFLYLDLETRFFGGYLFCLSSAVASSNNLIISSFNFLALGCKNFLAKSYEISENLPRKVCEYWNKQATADVK